MTAKFGVFVDEDSSNTGYLNSIKDPIRDVLLPMLSCL